MSHTQQIVQQDYSTHWELRQLVKSGLFADEDAALRSALRALYQAHPQARVQMVVRAYAAGEISLGRAAALLGASQEEMKISCAKPAPRFTSDPRPLPRF